MSRAAEEFDQGVPLLVGEQVAAYALLMRDEGLKEAGWVPCSPEWLATHPNECGSTPRLPGGPDLSHWHPQVTRADMRREIADWVVSGCFNHGPADSQEGWLDCHCPVADELRRKVRVTE